MSTLYRYRIVTELGCNECYRTSMIFLFSNSYIKTVVEQFLFTVREQLRN